MVRWSKHLALVLLVSLTSCSSDPQPISVDQLATGVQASVDDPANVIESAEVFLPDELPGYLSTISAQLELGEVVVLSDLAGYDRVIVYRTGPYCGTLPKITAKPGEASIHVDIESLIDGECEDLEYDEAVGIQLASEHAGDTLTATHD